MDTNYWQGKQVLVTGADGFIGSHLTEALVKAGAQVRALTLYNSFNSWGWLDSSELLSEIEVVSGDVRDPFLCKKITQDCHTVFHLAALIAIPYSYIAPNSYVETNVNGTLNMAQACLENGVERFMHTSTSEIYGTAQYVPIDENHPPQPQSPYSASKIGADAMAMSYYNAFEMPVSIARPFNTYGPRQSARAVIPTIISQIASGMEQIKLGDTSPTRDFNYVADTCRGMMLIAQSAQTIGETINIGSNFEISVQDTLELIKEIMASDVEFIQDEQRLRPKDSEVFRLWCDNRLIHELTGFEPQYDIRAGLEQTIAWFSNSDNLKHYKAGIYNV
ncbi:NAD-dependent 4,6-dehydratase LegB [Thiomicrorhabdus sediminis]|uniref:NAD-dependent epimerase/dehydratase family protein n=1 Tax=Thiomicrorhabdus sediminis TaxID=2580412 RepID=A0A4P9K6J6_9GAMM|nr:NAD-dependent 4,6-dehydratase LegB [Thiomicrorhabdus sediminis]QCU90481.1 NAD-dependent epimerase/dehydratase family protein [Thiomicrorhabdus sediminis]